MAKSSHLHLSDVRGLQRLATDATVGITDIVEALHHTIARTPGILGQPVKGTTTGITGLVYRSVRGVTRLVGGSIDALLALVEPLAPVQRSTPAREATVAALNGVLGDYLEATRNPLAIPMRFRVDGAPLELSSAALTAAFPRPAGHVLVLAHGLCMSDLQWMREGHDHGLALARDLRCAPVYLHYNTGRHISHNGRAFADALEALVRHWPHPVERLTILGHSMGGLVARSACHYAALARHRWLLHLGDLVFIGTPHQGAPLERAGALADLLIGLSPYSAPFARLGKVRSDGIKDLGYAFLRDEDWQTPALRTPPPLPAGVRCYAMAGSKQKPPRASRKHLRGDGLVPVASALGAGNDESPALDIPEAHRWIGYGMGHFDLLHDPAAYDRIRSWLE